MKRIFLNKDDTKVNKRFYLTKRLIETLLLSLVLGVFSHALLIAFQTNFDWNRVYLQMFEIRPELFWMGSLILVIIYWWIISIVGDRTIGAILFIGLSFIIGIITHQKMLLRGEPFYPSDISMISSFFSLLKMVDIQVILFSLILILLTVLLIFIILRRKKEKKLFFARKKSFFTRLALFLITTLFLFYIGNFNKPGNYVRDLYDQYAVWTTFSQQDNYLHNGFVSGFLFNLDGPVLNKPENYSKETMENLVQKYQKKANEINSNRDTSLSDVNIVYIMNETFSDPMKIEGISVSENPIPLTQQRMKESVSGEVLSQGYGGGTANIEFEALTGISMEPLEINITTPFIQMTEKMTTIPSVVNFLTSNGYEATAIHPFNTSMYKRKDVYKNLGFSTFLYEDNMKNTEKIENNRYISDESSYKEVINRMSETQSVDFIHLVTMQNHAVYSGKYEKSNFTVKGVPEISEAENYLQDLSYSDQALDKYLEKINKIDEKVVTVFWGDHLPSFYGNDIYKQNGKLTMHQTPFMIYSNYNNVSNNIGTISPIYFMNHVLEQTNAFVSPYYALLMALEEKMPAFEKGIYIESNQTSWTTRDKLSKETWEILKDYELILYDMTDGANYSSKLNFYND